MRPTIPLSLTALFCACVPLDEPRDVTGNFAVSYANDMRVYIDDELVAEVAEGEDATVEWNGETFQISTLCSDEGVECPDETFWGEVAVDQPWGPEYALLNFVNLDEEHGTPGQRLGGLLDDDGSFSMLSGLALDGNGNCAVLGVGLVEGVFNADATAIEDGVITYAWAAGCKVGDATISGSLRVETDFTAERTGDYDVSGVTPEEPIDEEGDPVDPEDPDESYAARRVTADGLR